MVTKRLHRLEICTPAMGRGRRCNEKPKILSCLQYGHKNQRRVRWYIIVRIVGKGRQKCLDVNTFHIKQAVILMFTSCSGMEWAPITRHRGMGESSFQAWVGLGKRRNGEVQQGSPGCRSKLRLYSLGIGPVWDLQGFARIAGHGEAWT